MSVPSIRIRGLGEVGREMKETTARIRLTIADDVARLTLDDGRANAMGSAFLAELESNAFDHRVHHARVAEK